MMVTVTERGEIHAGVVDIQNALGSVVPALHGTPREQILGNCSTSRLPWRFLG
jgi:hypothetical protein